MEGEGLTGVSSACHRKKSVGHDGTVVGQKLSFKETPYSCRSGVLGIC